MPGTHKLAISSCTSRSVFFAAKTSFSFNPVMSRLKSRIFPGGFTNVFNRTSPVSSTTDTPTSALVSVAVSHISQSTPKNLGFIPFSTHHRVGLYFVLRHVGSCDGN